MDKKIHFKEKIKNDLRELVINYSDVTEEELNIKLKAFENKLRHEAYYYIRHGDYDSNEIIEILTELSAANFFINIFEGLDFKNKDFMLKRLHSIFVNLKNYMKLIKNWS
jgi:hypothetical protein